MRVLGIFAGSESQILESSVNLKRVHLYNNFSLFSDKDPHLKNSSLNIFDAYFGYFFKNNRADSFTQPVDFSEGFYLNVQVNKTGDIIISTDAQSRLDIYYINNARISAFSTDLELLLNLIREKLELNQMAAAHSLSIYGNRAPKKDTLFSSVSRLGYRQKMMFQNNNLTIQNSIPEIYKTDIFRSDKDFLKLYSDSFINSLDKRASEENIIFFSSGWDSTSIAAGLVHLKGAKKVRCIIGEMNYSKRYAAVNKYEIERAKIICEQLNVELNVINFDYATQLPEGMDEIEYFLKSNQLANLTSINHFLLARASCNYASADTRIFAGEMSDGAHNLGFSQYVSIFHPNSIDFREYSDKMRSYLFGPSFLDFISKNDLKKDPIWNYIRNQSSIELEIPKAEIRDLVDQFLTSFFLRNSRLPFTSKDDLKLLTAKGASAHEIYIKDNYFSILLPFYSTQYLYSLYLELYNSFHWQASTVNSLEIAGSHFNLELINPFHDIDLIKLLKIMPEHMGRGLDLNPTKYPLKWTLEHRLNYDLAINKGLHSYLYDDDPRFSHSEEILFHSELSSFFKSRILSTSLFDKLNDHLFDMKYINKLKSDYTENREIDNRSFSDLLSISMHSVVI